MIRKKKTIEMKQKTLFLKTHFSVVRESVFFLSNIEKKTKYNKNDYHTNLNITFFFTK